MARELIVLSRFKRDYKRVKGHPDFDPETLQYVFDLFIEGTPLPSAFNEHLLDKRAANWAGFAECHLAGDLLLIYRITTRSVTLHRIGTHAELFSAKRKPRKG